MIKNAHSITSDFARQPRFHDHIIHDAESFERIQLYIKNNPENWKEDKFYTVFDEKFYCGMSNLLSRINIYITNYVKYAVIYRNTDKWNLTDSLCIQIQKNISI